MQNDRKPSHTDVSSSGAIDWCLFYGGTNANVQQIEKPEKSRRRLGEDICSIQHLGAPFLCCLGGSKSLSFSRTVDFRYCSSRGSLTQMHHRMKKTQEQ